MISAWWLLLLAPCAIVYVWFIYSVVSELLSGEVKIDNLRQFREGMRHAYEHPEHREAFLREYYERKDKK